MSEPITSLFVITLMLVLLLLYFLPFVVATRRGHPQETPILICNLFFGWTVLGWGVCLAWAAQGFQRQPELV